jgi:flagellar biogenesis protein FliO
MRVQMRAIASIAAVALTGAPVWAQQTGLGRSPWSLLAQALLSLGVVVGVIYLVYFGLRRFQNRQLDVEADGPIRVIQARRLGGDQWLYLVEIEGRRLVVGGADGQITPIAELGANREETDNEG